MTKEQEFHLNEARSNLRAAVDMIEALFDDKTVTPEDVDSDTSECIDKCNSAIGSLYAAKPEAK